MNLRTILIMVGALIVLGVVFYFSSRPEPAEPVEPQYFVWDVEMDELQTMAIGLAREDMSESWVKHEDQYWYFDMPNGPKVDMKRWGGGIPLLLSGPGANRRLVDDATDEQLESYGVTNPLMLINLTLENGKSIDIEVGDSTPDGQFYYIRLEGQRRIYTVDFTWYEVLRRLITDPPYPGPEEE